MLINIMHVVLVINPFDKIIEECNWSYPPQLTTATELKIQENTIKDRNIEYIDLLDC